MRYKKKPVTLESYNSKLPPSDIEIEEAVLGSILINSSLLDDVIADFTELLFFGEYNKIIARHIIDAYNKNLGIDMLTIVSSLRKDEKAKEVTAAYVSKLTSRIGSTVRFEYHFRILQENALKREMIAICGESLRKTFENEDDIYKLFLETQGNLENSFKKISNYKIKTANTIHKEILNTAWGVLNMGINAGIPTGLKLVDNLTNGWQKSDFIILAGRPSMGKTACAISMIMHPAIDLQIPIGVFSLEMSAEQLVSRMQSYMSGVNVGRIVKKQLTQEELVKIQGDCFKLEDAPIYIDDTAAITISDLKAKTRKLVKEHGVRLIVIDYLQLMRSGMNTFSREQEIAEISRNIKALAKELSIPIIALSQLSRSVEGRGGDKKPQLSDLRESGQIEQDADMVLFCYRPEYYGIESYEIGNEVFDSSGLFMLLVSKHRNGELGEIPLNFIHAQTKVDNRQLKFGNSNYSGTFDKPNTNVLSQARNTSFDEMFSNDDNPFI